MSFPLKEELIELEEMMKRAKQIYPDACDYGYVFENKDEKTHVRDLMYEFKDFYGVKTSRFHRGCQINFAILLGKECEDMYETLIVTFDYCDDFGPYGGFDLRTLNKVLSRDRLKEAYNSTIA